MKNKSKKMKRNTKKKKYNTKIPEGKIVIILLIIIVVLSIIPNIYTLFYNMAFSKGTEAASISETYTSGWGATAEGEPIKLIIDRPFMFLIYDQSINQVLFIGRVNNI